MQAKSLRPDQKVSLSKSKAMALRELLARSAVEVPSDAAAACVLLGKFDSGT